MNPDGAGAGAAAILAPVIPTKTSAPPHPKDSPHLKSVRQTPVLFICLYIRYLTVIFYNTGVKYKGNVTLILVWFVPLHVASLQTPF